MTSSLTRHQQDELETIEYEMELCVNSIIRFAQLANQIREKKLYVKYGTWEEYCKNRWNLTAKYVNQLVAAGPVMQEFQQVKSVSAAVELSKLPLHVRKDAVLKVSESGEVTVEKVKNLTIPKPPKFEKGPVDATGIEVPVESRSLWNRKNDAQTLLNSVSEMRSFLKRCQESGDVLFIELDYTDNLAKLNQIYEDLKRAIPHAVCHSCQGKQPKDCPICKGRGFVSKFYWDNCVPEEIKELRKL